jgi:hypothetical protein
MNNCRIQRLAWEDPPLGTLELSGGVVDIRAGFGSGLSVRPGDAPGVVWAVGDRGPNLKPKAALELGANVASLVDAAGAKIMPRPDIGPALAELRVHDDRVELLRTLRLTGASGAPLSGLPIPHSAETGCETAYTLDGTAFAPDPSGADTEGLAALADGGFWVGDEYGPSLLRVDEEGRVIARWVPRGSESRFEGADYPVEPALPAIAARRQLNRGFEAIALSEDGESLMLAFQSPLAHPDEEAHRKARHVRVWRLDVTGRAVAAQYLYRLGAPETFRRDVAAGPFAGDDVKIGEMLLAGPDTLLLLERGSHTSKIYRVSLAGAQPLGPEHLDIATRPTIEEMSAAGTLALPVLAKTLLFSSDDAPEVVADLEGMALLSDRELLLVSDNDFGVEGACSSFWRLTFDEPVGG